MTQPISWFAVSPPLAVGLSGLLALLVGAFFPSRRWLPGAVSLVGLGVATGLLVSMSGRTHRAFCLPDPRFPVACSWVVGHVTLVWWLLIVVATALVVLLTQVDVIAGKLPAGELHLLLLTSCAGGLAVAAAGDLVTLVVAMETVTLPVFGLVALRRADRRGAEAGLKFFVTSVVSTAFTALGVAMVYGATGSVAAPRVAWAVSHGRAVLPVIAVGMMLTVVGLGFKVALVPFQAWVPDTYVGAPVPVAAYLSVVSKVAGLAGITILFVRFFPAYTVHWSSVVAVVAALTMTVGNLAALRQQHAVRLLAWSSVAQAGYLLVPLAAGGHAADIGALQAYALMYAVANLGAFAVVTYVTAQGRTTIAEYTGLARGDPWRGVSLAFALLCLAGLPPGVVGLVAKVVVFRSAIDGRLTWLAVVMAVNVAAALVYYLRFAAALIRPPDQADIGAASAGHSVAEAGGRVVVVATLVAAVALSIYPAPLFTVLGG